MCRAQEVGRYWDEGVDPKPLAPSPEAADLLLKLLTADPKKRIRVEEILEHPWYNRPLPPRYQAALDALAEQQADLDRRWQTRCLSQVAIPAHPPISRAAAACKGHHFLCASQFPISLGTYWTRCAKTTENREPRTAIELSVSFVEQSSA